MKNSPLPFQKLNRQIQGDFLAATDLPMWIDQWLLACDISGHSETTTTRRRNLLKNLVWFCDHMEIIEVDTIALRNFMHYLANGHKQPGGRWGNATLTNPLRPQSLFTYHKEMKTFFRWLIAEEVITKSPLDRIPAPIARADQVEPFSIDEMNKIQAACRKSRYASRDRAIVDFLLDTGIRVNELCTLRLCDLSLAEGKAVVQGKGNKSRVVYFHRHAKNSMWQYLRGADRDLETDLVFMGEKGPLTRSGVQQMIERLAKAGGVHHAHPHKFRHTFAIMFLRAGGNTFTLQTLLGHTDIKMTQKYVALADADMANQHRAHSPLEFMSKRGLK